MKFPSDIYQPFTDDILCKSEKSSTNEKIEVKKVGYFHFSLDNVYNFDFIDWFYSWNEIKWFLA